MRFRLTPAAKVLIAVLAIVIVCAGIFAGLRSGIIKNDTKETADKVKSAADNVADKVKTVSKEDAEEYAGDDEDSVINMDKETSDTINLSLDEWIG